MIRLGTLAYFIPFLLLNRNAFGQQAAYASKMDRLLQTTNVVMVTQNGKAKYTKANGYASFDKKTPLKLADSFVILSNSKQITRGVR